ncbi:MAG: stage II sporulation protein P, partial [Clostridia bacterium]|nr:stage II sporulation protein P [Clostridia bacterium]
MRKKKAILGIVFLLLLAVLGELELKLIWEPKASGFSQLAEDSTIGGSLWELMSKELWPRVQDKLNSPLALWDFPVAAEWEGTEKDWETELTAWAEPELVDLGELSGQVLIGIYHTHTGETYKLTDGVDRIEGEGGVVQAGTILAEQLEKVGIKVVHSCQINDRPYNEAYNNSYQTAVNLLAENPEIRILLDLHRDSEKSRSQSMIEINGQKMAKIMFVAGSDARAAFPNWQKNKEFAETVSGRLNEKYPGLCSGVTVKEGRYNQFLHNHALLVE